MKILFLTDNFPPEVSPPATRGFAHCRAWARAGEDVTVISSVPNFPHGKVFAGYRNMLWQSQRLEGFRLIRVWSFISANEGFAMRVVDFVSFAVSSFFAGLFQPTDIIVTSSPQFFLGLSARALAFVKRKPWVFEVRDLWPESINAVGMMKKGLVYRMLEAMELHFYRSASAVIIVSEAFRGSLTKRGIPSEKIFTVPNGADLEEFQPVTPDPALRTSLGLDGKFVLAFIGTHGLAHGLDFILDNAPALAADNVQVMLIGAGAKKAGLVERAKAEHIANVTFVESIPRAEVPRYMALADAALVNLKKSDTFLSVIPSKIFEAAALERPILIGVDGIARQIIEEHDAGLFYAPDDGPAFLAAVRKLRSDVALYARLQQGCRALAQAYDRRTMAARALDVIRNAARR